MSHVITHEHAGTIRAFLCTHAFLRSEAVRLWGSVDDAVQELWAHCARVCHRWPEHLETGLLVWKTCGFRIRHQRTKQCVQQTVGDFWGLPARQQSATVEVTDEVEFVLAAVTSREAEVLRERYLAGKTLAQVASEMGLSSARVQQIEREAAKRVRGAA